MTGLVLRLAGPMQSWGEHSRFGERDTVAYPTRSGVVGMFAGAMGLPRGESLTRFDDLRLTVRVDSPGVPLTDFHTVGGGLPPARTAPIADGKHRSGANAGTIVSRRRYLCDAVFTLAVTGPERIVDEVGEALLRPVWQPYLGRRSCPPDQPVVLRRHAPDAEDDLRERIPLPRRPHLTRSTDGDVDVDLITESDPAVAGAGLGEGSEPGSTAVTELLDVPVNFDPLDRRYRQRLVYRQVVAVPAGLLRQPGRDYRDALFRYMREGA